MLDQTPTLLRILAVAVAALLTAVSPRASPAEVDPQVLCSTHHAIRQPVAWWSSQECQTFAEAFNRTVEPDRLSANCFMESDGKQKSLYVVLKPGEHLRSRKHPGYKRSGARTWISPAGIAIRPGDTVDAGLCGLRCVVGDDGRCKSGVTSGRTIEELLDPVTNIDLAGRLWKIKLDRCGARAPSCWKGLVDDHGKRASEIAAVLSAQRGRAPKDARIARGLAAKIAHAMKPETGRRARKS